MRWNRFWRRVLARRRDKRFFGDAFWLDAATKSFSATPSGSTPRQNLFRRRLLARRRDKIFFGDAFWLDAATKSFSATPSGSTLRQNLFRRRLLARRCDIKSFSATPSGSTLRQNLFRRRLLARRRDKIVLGDAFWLDAATKSFSAAPSGSTPRQKRFRRRLELAWACCARVGMLWRAQGRAASRLRSDATATERAAWLGLGQWGTRLSGARSNRRVLRRRELGGRPRLAWFSAAERAHRGDPILGSRQLGVGPHRARCPRRTCAARFEQNTAPSLDRLRTRLLHDGRALVWFRTCETFGARAGQSFARALADRLGARVAGHTYVIGVLQSGLHGLLPGNAPHWDPNEGLARGTPDSPALAHSSSEGAPNTIHFMNGSFDPAWFRAR